MNIFLDVFDTLWLLGISLAVNVVIHWVIDLMGAS
jgi:hypothetical protein